MHELRIHRIDLVGGNRTIEFAGDFAVISGSITTGKTTVVRLIRSLLGRVPGHLPPETGSVRSVRGRVSFGAHMWEIDRPLVTTKTATVSLSRREPADDDDEAERIVDALRLPAEQPTAAEAETYLEWLLARRMCGPQLACDRWARPLALDAQNPPHAPRGEGDVRGIRGCGTLRGRVRVGQRRELLAWQVPRLNDSETPQGVREPGVGYDFFSEVERVR